MIRAVALLIAVLLCGACVQEPASPKGKSGDVDAVAVIDNNLSEPSPIVAIRRRGGLRVSSLPPLQGPPVPEHTVGRYDEDPVVAFCANLRVFPIRKTAASVQDLVGQLKLGKIDIAVIGWASTAAVAAFVADGFSYFSSPGWLLRADSGELLTTAKSFIAARAMTTHTRELVLGDLDEIRKRGEIRVITRNTGVSYAIHRGKQVGFDYELALMLARELGVRLQVVVPRKSGEMIDWLLAGKGDFIAASFTATPERQEQVAFSRPYLYVDEMLVGSVATTTPSIEDAVSTSQTPAVGGEQAPPQQGWTLGALSGQTVVVRASSSYYRTLLKLAQYIDLRIELADEETETEELLAMVASGEISFTVADSHILQAERTYGVQVAPILNLTMELEQQESLAQEQSELNEPVDESAAGGGSDVLFDVDGAPKDQQLDVKPVVVREQGDKHIVFAVRPQSKALLAYIDDFVRRRYRGTHYNLARRRYFTNARSVRAAHDGRLAALGVLSPYDALIRRHSERFGFDWRLMAALAYQESRFEPSARSWAGAVGLFQLMPATARDLGVSDAADPGQAARGGIQYMRQLLDYFDESIALRQRIRFALASYNAGLGHVLDARRLARELGLDPNRWFGNVEKAMLLLARPSYAAKARHGYCRGSEPVDYVSRIQARYDAYSKLAEL